MDRPGRTIDEQIDEWLDGRGTYSGLIRFDVHAESPAFGASAAMWLRQAIPGLTVRSMPDPRPADEPELAHVLHCGALVQGRAPDETREVVRSVIERLGLVGDGGRPRARFEFEDEAALLDAA
jgi:hypothetical protein